MAFHGLKYHMRRDTFSSPPIEMFVSEYFDLAYQDHHLYLKLEKCLFPKNFWTYPSKFSLVREIWKWPAHIKFKSHQTAPHGLMWRWSFQQTIDTCPFGCSA